MHELSIVASILEIVEKSIPEDSHSKVEQIELQIGDLAGVDREAFDFAWYSAVANTSFADTKRVIRRPNGLAHCLDCDKDFKIHSIYDACPHCHQFFNTIVSGQELSVLSVTLN